MELVETESVKSQLCEVSSYLFPQQSLNMIRKDYSISSIQKGSIATLF